VKAPARPAGRLGLGASLPTLVGSATTLAVARPIWAHHPIGGGDEGAAWAWLLVTVLLGLAGIAAWAFFGPGPGEPDGDDHTGEPQ
jgi:hypothetical protein